MVANVIIRKRIKLLKACWRGPQITCWVAGLLMVVPLLIVLARNYYVRAFSDPYNWLMYARHFADEVGTARWPYGYALFLRLLLPVTGPYYIFLSNIPVLVLSFLLVGALARRLVPSPVDVRVAVPAALAAFAFAASADVRSLIHYANPYRDPLSLVLLLWASWWFVRAVQERTVRPMFTAGVLWALACSVREPSILMGGPFFLYGVLAWNAADGRKRQWQAAGLFLAGFVLAMIPLLLQTYLATAQVIVSPQAAAEGRVVPGAHFNLAVWLLNWPSMSAFYWHHLAPLVVWAVLGLVWGVIHRQKEVIWLVMPSILVYAMFYLFYWTFVTRYFYVVTLWLCVLAGYGLHHTSRWLFSRLPEAWRSGAVKLAMLALVVFCWTAYGRARFAGDGFRIPDARAFATKIQAALPAESVIFAPRHLCEAIYLLGERRSYPVPIPHDPAADIHAALQAHVMQLWDEGRTVYAAEIPAPGQPLGQTTPLRQLFQLEPVLTMDPAAYRMARYAAVPFVLHELRPWSKRRAEQRLEWPDPAEPRWWALDTTAFARLGAAGVDVELVVDGEPLPPERWQAYSLFMGRPAGQPDGPTVRWQASQPVPREVPLHTGTLAEPIDLWFNLWHPLAGHARWTGEIHSATPADPVPRLYGAASYKVPVPLPDTGTVQLEWRVRSAFLKPEAGVQLDFYEGDERLTSYRLPFDRRVHGIRFALPADAERDERRIRVVTASEHPLAERGPKTPVAEIHRLLIHRVGAGRYVEVPVGAMADAPYVEAGFYARERVDTAEPFRWTAKRAVLQLPIMLDDQARLLAITFSLASVPPTVQQADPLMQVRWNGVPWPAEALHWERDGHEVTLRTVVPATALQATNQLELKTTTWSPSEHGFSDRRELGVRLMQVKLGPAPADGQEHTGHGVNR